MEDLNPEDIQQALRALSTGVLFFDRATAVRKLGGLSFTNQNIVQALAAAQVLDEHANVREMAGEALQAPVHQEFIKEHPGLISQAVEAAKNMRQQREQAEESRLMEEFLRRRDRQRTRNLLLSAAVLFYFVIVIVLIEYEWSYPLATVIFFAFMGGLLWLSWRDYRCPSCDGSLGGFKAQVNPFFSTSPTWCPHCGKRLL
jgi:hypothetical protein